MQRRKHSQTEKKHNERKRKGFEKKLLLISFDNFQGQFSRQRKEK
jgi:hypothetical protein